MQVSGKFWKSRAININKMKNHLIIFFITLSILAISCKKNDNNISDNKYYNQSRYSKLWVQKVIENNLLKKTELFISKDFDTIENQTLIFRDKQIQNQSLYYNLKIVPGSKKGIYECKIQIHSWLDSIPKEEIVETNYDFSFTQKIRDSIFLKSVKVKNSSQIDFTYNDFDDNLIEGIITGQIITKSKDSSKLEVSEIKILVSNKKDINEAIVKTYFGKK